MVTGSMTGIGAKTAIAACTAFATEFAFKIAESNQWFTVVLSSIFPCISSFAMYNSTALGNSA